MGAYRIKAINPRWVIAGMLAVAAVTVFAVTLALGREMHERFPIEALGMFTAVVTLLALAAWTAPANEGVWGSRVVLTGLAVAMFTSTVRMSILAEVKAAQTPTLAQAEHSSEGTISEGTITLFGVASSSPDTTLTVPRSLNTDQCAWRWATRADGAVLVCERSSFQLPSDFGSGKVNR